MTSGVDTPLSFANTTRLKSYLVVYVIMFPAAGENTHLDGDTRMFCFLFCESPVHILTYFSLRLSFTIYRFVLK